MDVVLIISVHVTVLNVKYGFTFFYFPYICSDSENEKSKSIEYSESVADKSVDMPQPGEFSFREHSSGTVVCRKF